VWKTLREKERNAADGSWKFLEWGSVRREVGHLDVGPSSLPVAEGKDYGESG